MKAQATKELKQMKSNIRVFGGVMELFSLTFIGYAALAFMAGVVPQGIAGLATAAISSAAALAGVILGTYF